MKRWLQGFVVGIVVATGVGLSAQPSYYYTVGKMARSDGHGVDYLVQLGYAAGVSDALSALNWRIAHDPQAIRQLPRWEDCMTFRGKDAGALRAFAMAAWRDTWNKQVSAAVVLLSKACEQ